MGDDFAIADKNANWVVESTNVLCYLAELEWLPYGNAVLLCEYFDAWRGKFVATTFWTIWLGDDGCNWPT